MLLKMAALVAGTHSTGSKGFHSLSQLSQFSPWGIVLSDIFYFSLNFPGRLSWCTIKLWWQNWRNIYEKYLLGNRLTPERCVCVCLFCVLHMQLEMFVWVRHRSIYKRYLLGNRQQRGVSVCVYDLHFAHAKYDTRNVCMSQTYMA